jgi:hypothetical protein
MMISSHGTKQMDPALLRQEAERWPEVVTEFCDQLAEWSRHQGWEVKLETIQVTEDEIGTYSVPQLWIKTTTGTVIAEPIARFVFGGQGRIDLFAYPTLYRVMLLRDVANNTWRIRTDSGIYLRQPWQEETFADLVADLEAAGHELPSHPTPALSGSGI